MLRQFKMCTSQMLLLYVFFPWPSCENPKKELAVFLNKYNILSALPFPNKTLTQRHASLVTHSSPFTGSPLSPGHKSLSSIRPWHVPVFYHAIGTGALCHWPCSASFLRHLLLGIFSLFVLCVLLIDSLPRYLSGQFMEEEKVRRGHDVK